MRSRAPWTITPALWPPRRPVLDQFGATTVEVVRSCALRVCFQRDDRFPARLNTSAQIGTAIHAAVESTATAEFGRLGTLKERYGYLDKVFVATLTSESQKSLVSYRNRLPIAVEEVLSRHRRVLIAIAREAAEAPVLTATSKIAGGRHSLPPDRTSLREVEVRDPASGLVGRIDRIQHSDDGVEITDFKATGRRDVPDRYRNQVKLYAALWQLNHGHWPTAGWLHYLLSNTTHLVLIDPVECAELLNYARSLPRIFTEQPIEKLANPGDPCKVCSYRPWCEPFWEMRRTQDESSGLISELASVGMAGQVVRITRGETETQLRLRWANRFALVIVPLNLFPHAADIEEGQVVRILGGSVTGQSHQPTIRLGEQSELFCIES